MRPGRLERGHGQQHAALRVLGDVGHRGCRQLAGEGHPTFLFGPAPFLLRLAPLVQRHEAAHQGDHQGDCDGGALPAQAPVVARLAVDAVGLLPHLAVAKLLARLEELPLGLRKLGMVEIELVEHDLETGAPVERPGVALQLDPVARRLAQVAHRQDGLPVLLDPAPQARPLAEQGLVCELDRRDARPGVAVERQQACLRPPVDHRVDGCGHAEAGELRPGSAPTGGLTFGADDHETFEHPAHGQVFVVVER
jgi:hypothetical protein